MIKSRKSFLLEFLENHPYEQVEPVWKSYCKFDRFVTILFIIIFVNDILVYTSFSVFENGYFTMT